MTEHIHGEPKGSPFDFNEPITCPACVNRLWDLRDELCAKYGWDAWPDALNRGRDYLPPRIEG